MLPFQVQVGCRISCSSLKQISSHLHFKTELIITKTDSGHMKTQEHNLHIIHIYERKNPTCQTTTKEICFIHDTYPYLCHYLIISFAAIKNTYFGNTPAWAAGNKSRIPGRFSRTTELVIWGVLRCSVCSEPIISVLLLILLVSLFSHGNLLLYSI
jgi:hypothetical protein